MNDMPEATSRVRVLFGSTVCEVDPNKPLLIGRSPQSGLQISHELISRSHARVFLDESSNPPAWVIEDAGSANGMFVDGKSVSQVSLKNQGIVRLGDPNNGPALKFELYQLVPRQAVREAPRIDDVEKTVNARLSPSWASASSEASNDSLHTTSARATVAVAPRRDPEVGVVIGKAVDADFILADVLVSRRHAMLTGGSAGFVITDLGSTNGTFVNGQIVAAAPVFEGDVITIGNTDLTIRRGELDYLRSSYEDQSGGLSVTGLTFTIKGGKTLLKDINVRAAPGTLTAVIGPSGAGKSTFAKMVAGLTEPTSGHVVFDGFDVHKNFDIIRSRIGLVPQDDVLHTSLKLEQALTFASRLRLNLGNDELARKAQVDKVIGQLELDKHRDTRIDKLSGGQRKRASVALELLTEPSLLLLDEPTSGLDPALDRQVMQTLRGLATGDRAVLVVTHSVAFLDVCDAVLILAPGGMPAYYGPASGIAEFFGTDDWADIFASLAAAPVDAFNLYVERTGNPVPEMQEKVRDSGTSSTITAPPWLRQFSTLCARQFTLILADKAYLGFLLALPIIVGLLVLVVPGNAGLGMADVTTPGEPAQLIAMLVIGSSFMGASISVRDLVGERPIFLRERAVGLPISAYLASKLVVFGLSSWLMAGILTVVTFAVKPPPTQYLVISSSQLELFLALGLTANTSMILGLLLSALVRSSEQAMPLLIIVLMAQLVLNGGLLPLADRPFVYELSALIVAKWGFAMVASGVDLQNISPQVEEDMFWDHTMDMWILSAAAIVAFGIIFTAMTRIRLESKYLR